jgi:hypothetical protein
VAFTGPAVDAGVRAISGFPIGVGSVQLGALNLYANTAGPLTDDQHADALVMAEIAGQAVLVMQTEGAGAALDLSGTAGRSLTSLISCAVFVKRFTKPGGPLSDRSGRSGRGQSPGRGSLVGADGGRSALAPLRRMIGARSDAADPW